MPEGGIFSTAGQAGFVPNDDLAWTIALLSSRICTFLLSLSQGRTGDAAQFEVGLVKRLPWPRPNALIRDELALLARSAFENTVELRSIHETSHFFVRPPAIRFNGKTLLDRYKCWQAAVQCTSSSLAAQQARIDEIAFGLYGLSENDIAISNAEAGSDSNGDDADDSDQPVDSGSNCKALLDTPYFTRSLISHLFGCVLGVWDVRRVEDKEGINCPVEPATPLPIMSPGRLQERIDPQADGYPLSIASDGILVDDRDHADDVVRRLRDVFEIVWSDQADAIEAEACELLGVNALGDYLRKPGKGGFWDDHISRYSDGRRNAPVYWLLQSSKRNYALWLYYPRLDKDFLFKALVNYVEPKIRLETDRLATLRSQNAAAAESGKEAKKMAKLAEQQEDLLSELRDFEDKLRRAANLHLEADLNDGVVLNIASLHELVPWKEAKNYWEELLDGKYEWSSIGKQLRQKGLVK